MEVDIGGKLRRIRSAKNITIKELAGRAGMTSSLISQMERGLTMPSIATLIKVTECLEIPVGVLFEDVSTRPSPVIRKDERQQVRFGREAEHFYELLSGSGENKCMSFKYNEWTPGAGTGLSRHEGEECGLVLEGVMELTVGDEVYILEEGDSFYFDSRIYHNAQNIGKKNLRAIWVNSPPNL